MAIGFRINRRIRKVDAAVVEKFRDLPVANVSDGMSRMAAGGPRLRPLHSGGGLAGPALTVKTRPGDNLMVHAALNRAEPGDVLVVDAGGVLTNSIIGELMLTQAEKVGFRGCRDLRGGPRSRLHSSQQLPRVRSGRNSSWALQGRSWRGERAHRY